MTRTRLSGKVGAALDPCAAIQVSFDLAAGQEREIVFRLGVGRDADDAGKLVNRFRGSTAAREALDRMWQHWNHTLGAVNVETPDQSFNLLANGWLLYQTLACRLWARSATYQSGGAFGFRDQLQDVMALIYASQTSCASTCSFARPVSSWKEMSSIGGILHWAAACAPIAPMITSGCRSAACRYVLSTGDTGVLDEPVHFVQGRPVKADEDSYYDLPGRSEEAASLYEHCVRAILNGLKFGEHGLPLIGSGDWNDGMNLVGEHGKGESVWLGFFLYEVLMQFTEGCPHARRHLLRRALRSRGGRAAPQYREAWLGRRVVPPRLFRRRLTAWDRPATLNARLIRSRRVGLFLSGAGDHERSRMAMEAVDERLVRREQGLIQLLDPPFDKSELNPGYIKGYVPGVRENGGQYTHAAVWAAMAFARLGDNRRAWELFTMINPVNHAISSEDAAIYKVEPYVASADVYALSPHTGRGGWTWYTGSAGWMYRLIVESLLGLRLEVDKLRFAPCLPSDWKGFKMHYRYRETVYHIAVVQLQTGNDEMSVTVDGVEQLDKAVPLVDDHREHSVEVRINAVGRDG